MTVKEIGEGLEKAFRDSHRCDNELFCSQHKDCSECDAKFALKYLHKVRIKLDICGQEIKIPNGYLVFIPEELE